MESRQNDINQLTRFLFTLYLTNKLYHWNTLSYSRHIASDRFNSTLLELTDRFVETFIGKYKIKPMFSIVTIPHRLLNDRDITDFYREYITLLENLENTITDSELLAIRDELLSHLDQTLYVMSLE